MSDTDTVSKDGTDGLETVEWQVKDLADGWFNCGTERGAKAAAEPFGAAIRELVTRSQAESEIRKVRQDAEELLAAKEARIKELEERIETENLYQHEAIEENDTRAEALEAKLAAAEKVREAAIELDEAISDDFNIFGAQQKLRAALGGSHE